VTAEHYDPYRLPDTPPPLPPGSIKVLCLSGGGYRGLFTAAVLQALEARFSADPKHPTPFGQHFDLIAGTSIGGILATALACDQRASAMAASLERDGPTIFPAMRLRGLRKLFRAAPYKPQNLRQAITRLLPNADSMRLASLAKPLMLTTVNWGTSKLQLLGSAGTPQPDALRLTLMDAMLATSAAPAHFPAHAVREHRFVDGGLAANAPDIHALHWARNLRPGAQVLMLSIGTANPTAGRDPASIPQRGLSWAKPIIELVMTAQELHSIDTVARQLPDSYVRLNAPPSMLQQPHLDFDVANVRSTQLLRTLATDCVASMTPAQEAALQRIFR
jgi:uncharacterized protein